MPMTIAIVVSRFNAEITERLLDGAKSQLNSRGIDDQHITTVWVPGAVELPLAAQQFARSGCVQAIICLGAVIQGDTDHYDYVCQQVSYGCQRVSLTHNVPVIFGVLTTQNNSQALARVGGHHGHKGRDAADTALAMIDVMQTIGLCHAACDETSP